MRIRPYLKNKLKMIKRSKEPFGCAEGPMLSGGNAFRLLPFDKLRDQSASFGQPAADMVL